MVVRKRGTTMTNLEMVKKGRMVKQLLRMVRRRRMERRQQMIKMRRLRVMLRAERKRERTSQHRCIIV